MIQIVFVVLGLVYFIDALFTKWNWWDKLAQIIIKVKYKFVYELLNCRFCLMFHLSCMVTIVYGTINGFSNDLFLVPILVSGLINLKEKR